MQVDTNRVVSTVVANGPIGIQKAKTIGLNLGIDGVEGRLIERIALTCFVAGAEGSMSVRATIYTLWGEYYIASMPCSRKSLTTILFTNSPNETRGDHPNS